jgi:hypothetical protein
MNKRPYLLLIAAVALILSSFTDTKITNQEKIDIIVIPDTIKVIIDQSCYMCHNSDAKNKKAKMKFNFDKLDKLSLSKQISKLSKIAREVEKGDMPPEKFLEKNPSKELSAEDEQALIEWAKSYAKKLAK